MSTFVKDRLALISQGITSGNGRRIWFYTDTGAVGDIQEVAGYFGPAKDMGMDTGDLVMLKANNGLTTLVVRSAAMHAVQDTGASQGTLGATTVIGDTS